MFMPISEDLVRLGHQFVLGLNTSAQGFEYYQLQPGSFAAIQYKSGCYYLVDVEIPPEATTWEGHSDRVVLSNLRSVAEFSRGAPLEYLLPFRYAQPVLMRHLVDPERTDFYEVVDDSVIEYVHWHPGCCEAILRKNPNALRHLAPTQQTFEMALLAAKCGADASSIWMSALKEVERAAVKKILH